jgi:hypothetical protein
MPKKGFLVAKLRISSRIDTMDQQPRRKREAQLRRDSILDGFRVGGRGFHTYFELFIPQGVRYYPIDVECTLDTLNDPLALRILNINHNPPA